MTVIMDTDTALSLGGVKAIDNLILGRGVTEELQNQPVVKLGYCLSLDTHQNYLKIFFKCLGSLSLTLVNNLQIWHMKKYIIQLI